MLVLASVVLVDELPRYRAQLSFHRLGSTERPKDKNKN